MSDADLIRFLDGETGARERDVVAARIESDPLARARLETLRARSADARAWLQDLGPADLEIGAAAREMRAALDLPAVRGSRTAALVVPGPFRAASQLLRAAPPLLRAAVIILVLASAAAAIPATRALLAGAVTRAADALGLRAAAPAAVPPSGEAEADVVYSFVVAGDTLDVVISGVPAGRLLLRRTTTSKAVAELHGGTGAEVVLERDHRLRFVSAGRPDALLAIGLPPHVSVARVRVGDHAAVVHALPRDRDARIELRLEPR